MKITFVSCWYNLKSKFDINKYKTWIENFLSNVKKFKLIIYTNKESYYVIEPFVKNNSNIEVIFKEWEEFYTYKWRDKWIENHKKNNNFNGKKDFKTDWKLNMLWNEKINFIKETEKNFTSDWYVWCDIGYFRGGNNLAPSEIKEWPNLDKFILLDIEKIYYGQVCNDYSLKFLKGFVKNKNLNGMPKKSIPPNQISIAGGFFLIHKKKIDWWHNIYYNRLNDYFFYKYLVKDDQIIILDCIINNIENFSLIRDNLKEKNIDNYWFVFQRYLK
jgi:hypothetical protein